MMKRSRDDDTYYYTAGSSDQHKNKKPLLLYPTDLESISNQQFNKPQILDTGSSRICNLPDDVLHTILSYLPTKETVRTCILSRRWSHLWKTVPVLDFPDWKNERSDHRRFNKFVNKVCDLHAPFPLQRFHLKYAMLEHSDMDLLNKWLEYAITKRRVENLDFRLVRRRYNNRFPEQLPNSLFSSETLVELTLFLKLGNKLNLPSIIKLPKLKVLHLERVGLAKIQNLVDSAPSLEALHLIECIWKLGVEFDRISSLHLRELEIVGNLSMPGMSVRCPSLEILTFKGELVKEFTLCGPTKSLYDATIDLKMPISAENMFKLLFGVAAVRTLTFYVKSNKDLDSLSLHIEEYLEKFPVFENLVELKWSIISTNGRTEQTMLNKCPCLERMEFNLTKTPGDCERLHRLCRSMATTNLETHLKKVTIMTKFSYLRYEERQTIEFLLRRSLVLEQLVIVLPKGLKSPNRQQVAEAMLNRLNLSSWFYKASESCRISVVYYVNYRTDHIIMLTR